MKHIQIARTAPLALAAVLLFNSIASAHPGHGAQGLARGLEHPITGLDHMLAMVGVGLLAAGVGRRWLWLLPATFVASMLIGAGLGTAGLFVPSWLAETGIAASVVAFGLLITFGAKLPVPAIAALTSLFAICHGSAHAAEMPAGSSIAAFFVGFTISTVILHTMGLGLGLLIGRRGVAMKPSFAVQSCGMAMSVCGALMLVGVL